MNNLPDILFGLGFLLLMQLLVISATQRTHALRSWQSVLVRLGLSLVVRAIHQEGLCRCGLLSGR